MASTPPRTRRRRRLFGVILPIVVVASLLLVGFLVPLPHSFTEELSTPGNYDPVEQNVAFPVGTHVTGSWSTSNGTLAALTIRTYPYDSGTTVYLVPAQANSGSFSFTATNSTYVVAAGSLTPCTVHMSFSYSTPLF